MVTYTGEMKSKEKDLLHQKEKNIQLFAQSWGPYWYFCFVGSLGKTHSFSLGTHPLPRWSTARTALVGQVPSPALREEVLHLRVGGLLVLRLLEMQRHGLRMKRSEFEDVDFLRLPEKSLFVFFLGQGNRFLRVFP